MVITLKDLIDIVKELPEEYFDETHEKLTEIKKKSSEEETESKEQSCPNCNSSLISRNGKNRGKQMYLCSNCKKAFSETSTSAIAYSHSSPTVWKQVIRDTVEGVPINKTAENLDIHHETVFNMRHKILYNIEQSLIETPIELIGTCETDETYVLESEKGRKFPENYHREPSNSSGEKSEGYRIKLL